MAGRLKLLQPLKERDFALFWTGITVSLLGDGLFAVALAWQVYSISNVPTALALVGVAETVPLVAFLLIGGVVTDRVERRWVLIWSSLLRGICVAGLAWLATTDRIEIWQIIAIAFFYGAGQAFAGPSSGAIVPDLVPAPLLVQANSLAQFVRPLAGRLVGPAAGGWVVHELGTGAAFAADAATFGVVAAMLLLLTPRPAALDREAEPASVVADIREGFAFVRSHVWLWGTLIWAAFAVLLNYGAFEVLLPFVVKNHMHGDAGDLGLVLGAGGLGAVLSTLAIGQIGLPRRHITFMYGLWTVTMCDLVFYALAEVPWQAMAVALVAEGSWAVGLIIWTTLLQRLVPPELLGRVKSVDWFVSIGLAPLSFALIGPLAAWLGAQEVMFGAGIGAVTLTALFYFAPGMRDTERDDSPKRVVLSEPAM